MNYYIRKTSYNNNNNIDNNNDNNNNIINIIIIIIIIRLRSFCYSIAESNLSLHLNLRTIQNGKMWKAIKREQEIGEWGTGKHEKRAGRGEPGI